MDDWLVRSAGNPLRVSGLFEETKQRLKAEENDYSATAEVLKSRLRLLAKDGTCHSTVRTHTVMLRIPCFRRCQLVNWDCDIDSTVGWFE